MPLNNMNQKKLMLTRVGNYFQSELESQFIAINNNIAISVNVIWSKAQSIRCIV